MQYIIKLDTIKKVKDFCDAAEKINIDVYVQQEEYIVLARSIMGIFSLNLLDECELVIPNDAKVGEIADFIAELKLKDLIK